MFKGMIYQYVKKLTKEDIVKFAVSQNIQLKTCELNLIYDTLKNNLDDLFIDENKVLDKIKDKLEITTYLKIKELIVFYKKKYKNYL